MWLQGAQILDQLNGNASAAFDISVTSGADTGYQKRAYAECKLTLYTMCIVRYTAIVYNKSTRVDTLVCIRSIFRVSSTIVKHLYTG